VQQDLLGRQAVLQVRVQVRGLGFVPDGVAQGAKAPIGEPGGDPIVLQPRFVGARGRGVQLDQHLAPLDHLALLHVDGLDDPQLQWLDGLHPSAGDDLALSDGHHIHLADGGPGGGKGKEQDDRPDDGAGRRVGRRLLDLQGGGQEFEAVLGHLSVLS